MSRHLFSSSVPLEPRPPPSSSRPRPHALLPTASTHAAPARGRSPTSGTPSRLNRDVRIPKHDLEFCALALGRHIVGGLMAEELLEGVRHAVEGRFLRQSVAPASSSTGAVTEPGRLLTVAATASRLNLCRRSVWNLIQRQQLPVVRLSRRAIRIPEAALVALSAGAQRQGGGDER